VNNFKQVLLEPEHNEGEELL